MRRFRRDPLMFLEGCARRSPTNVFQLPWGTWCVRDTDLALAVLRDLRFNEGMSAFFGDMLPSRSAQVAFGRTVRTMVQAYVPTYCDTLSRAVAELPAVSRWPSTGTGLVYRCAADLLLHPEDAPELRRLMRQAVDIGLLIRRPHAWQRARVELLRPKLKAAVAEQVQARRDADAGAGAGEPRDVLDAVIRACPDEVTDRAVADLYGLMFVSIVGTVGYSVAWSLLLACLHAPGAQWPWPADWVVREAGRHRPVVWMVGRPIPHPAEFGGMSFEPGTILSVSPYLLHHDERRWTDPEVFRPERWARPRECGPYLPFGAGPFTCAGAAVAQTLIAATVAGLAQDALLTVSGGDPRPTVTNAAIPRPFVLDRRQGSHLHPPV